jgi:hypothetical protein
MPFNPAIEFADLKRMEVFCQQRLHPSLINILYWWYNKFGPPLVTSSYRPGPGIHGTDPLRAVDLRSFTYTDPRGLATIVNNTWSYDPVRPAMGACLYHNVMRNGNWGGWHFHVQVHPNTYKRI